MFFFENYNLQTISVLVVMLVLLILLNEITRRNKWMAIGMYIVLPIILSIFLWPKSAGAGTSGGYWFAWVKTFSALAGVIGFMAIRYIKKIRENKYAVFFPVAILVVNIIEAIFRDIEVYSMNGVFENGIYMQGGPWNIINAIAACSIAEKFKRGAWLQHRAMTLALWGMFSLSMNYAGSPMFAITSTHNPNALMTLSVLSLVANVAVFVYEIYTIIKTKRNPLKEEMYIHLESYKKNISSNGLLSVDNIR